MTTVEFSSLGLAEPLMRALIDADYTVPTPIQARTIPSLLEGRDLLGLAETGTGKTAAFALPILQRLAADTRRAAPRTARALILAPTRELAVQIADSFKTYGKHLKMSMAVVYGGVGSRPQIQAAARGLDILVATPGRLLDLIEGRHLSLAETRILVLDEADRMLDMGFIRDVRRIAKMLPKERQSLLFSATMPGDIAKLAAELLHNAVRVEVTHTGKTVDRVDQRVHFVENAQKRAALAALLQDPALERVIVFTRTKRGADRVARNLELVGIGAHAIHGNKSQGARQAALNSFKRGGSRVLIATDIASRGIDIDDITHVINYELPNIPESYVHRIGRTARAGARGIAIALCAGDERAYLRDIERLTRQPLVNAGPIPGIAEFAVEPPRGRDDRDDDRRGGRDTRHRGRPSGNGHRPARPARDSDGARKGGEQRAAPVSAPAHAAARPPHRSNDTPRGPAPARTPAAAAPRQTRPDDAGRRQGPNRGDAQRPHGDRRPDGPRGQRPGGNGANRHADRRSNAPGGSAARGR